MTHFHKYQSFKKTDKQAKGVGEEINVLIGGVKETEKKGIFP